MAEKSENFMQKIETKSVKMAVVEYRLKQNDGWEIREVLDWQTEGTLNRTCKRYAEDFPQYEFRWRYGWLEIDPSDKCETFKSE